MTKIPTAEAFVASVQADLADKQLTVNWLARRAGIAPSTLRYQLQRPAVMTVDNACAISAVLGVTP